jgi:hypothetical protein
VKVNPDAIPLCGPIQVTQPARVSVIGLLAHVTPAMSKVPLASNT